MQEIIFYLIALLIGILAGTFTGMIPGIHTNLLALILTTSLISLPFIPLLPAAIFIASMAITHTFISFIPSVFLGAPEEDTFLSVLPGHQMLKEGGAHEAIVLTLYGSIIAIIIILLFTPVFIFIIPKIAGATESSLPFLLIFISLFLVLREEKFLHSLFIFSLAGFLGFAALNLPVNQPLLPLLTGLFGSSALIISIKNKVKIPKQSIPKLKEIKLSKKEVLKASFGSVISAPLCSFLPGVGAGHAAIIGSEILEQSKKGFLILLGAINTIVMGLSMITLYSLGRTRTGTAAAIKEILPGFSRSDLTWIIISIILSGVLAFFIALYLSKSSAKYISKINYQILSLVILLILFNVILIFSNPISLKNFIIIFSLDLIIGLFTLIILKYRNKINYLIFLFFLLAGLGLLSVNLSLVYFFNPVFLNLFSLKILSIIKAFPNLIGLLIFITSTALGIFTILSGARRINLMGCLLIPTILFYLF